MKMNWKGAITPMLDSVKNSLIGRVHYPHGRFMEMGAHAITLETHSPETDSDTKEQKRERAMMWLFEKLVRIHDQLDEQLHAGFYFYILTAPSKFISNNQFIWALAILLVGLGAPLILDYLNHEL